MYQLWQTEDNNLVGVYPSYEDAMAVVRAALKADPRAAKGLALDRSNASGEGHTVAAGPDLRRLARGEDSGPKMVAMGGPRRLRRVLAKHGKKRSKTKK